MNRGSKLEQTRKCTQCGQTKPLSEFKHHREKKLDHDAKCRTCRLMNQWALRIQAQQKLGGKCIYPKCDVTDPRLLEFHHKNGGGNREDDLRKRNRPKLYREIIAGSRTDIDLYCSNHNQLKEYEEGKRFNPILVHEKPEGAIGLITLRAPGSPRDIRSASKNARTHKTV
jgi:hypothetical protein